MSTNRLLINAAPNPVRLARQWCRFLVIGLSLAMSLLIGCATGPFEYLKKGFKVGPNYRKPTTAVSEHWIDYQDGRIVSTPPNDAAWWQVFGDPVLNDLTRRAYAQNLTFRQRARRGLAGCARGWPWRVPGPGVAWAFLPPSGRGAGLLMEDAQRRYRAASLEAQYYRAVLTQPWGESHLDSAAQVRTGAGCRGERRRGAVGLVRRPLSRPSVRTLSSGGRRDRAGTNPPTRSHASWTGSSC